MIIEQHYDEEVLIGLLEEADHDSHVPGCETCAGTLESLRDLTSALRDNSVWDERHLSETPAPKTTNMLRAFAERTRAEDAAASSIVAKLIAAPSMLQAHPEWKTAGVVRKLLAVVDEKNYSEPKVAAEVAALAVEVAESIEPGLYPFDTIMKLRATAWRERAYALFYLGSYQESLVALDRTDTFLGDCAVSERDLAQAMLTRSQIYSEIERFDEAMVLAEKARHIFGAWGEVERQTVAEATIASLLMFGRRFAEGLTVQLQILNNMRVHPKYRAFAAHNAAICYRELSQFKEAKSFFAKAVTAFEELGIVSMRTRARWLLATVLIAESQYTQALQLLGQVRSDFVDLGMAQDVALVSVDMAEALMMLSRTAEVGEVCQRSMEYFMNAGLAYTEGALTALAYLREAASASRLTPTGLNEVRAYFEVLPKQPQLLFVRPV